VDENLEEGKTFSTRVPKKEGQELSAFPVR
jgi:hypothetical protein